MNKVLALTGLISLAAGCDSGLSYGEPKDPTPGQMQAAQMINHSVTAIHQAGAGPDYGLAMYGFASSIGGQAVERRQGLDLAPQALPEGCFSGDAETGWTYNACPSGSATLSGSVKISGQTVTYDLSISVSSLGTGYEVTLKGAVTNTGTAVTGDITYKAEVKVAGVGFGVGNTSVSTHIIYDIQYTQEPLCVSSGTVTVETDNAGQRAGARYEWSGCNEFKVASST